MSDDATRSRAPIGCTCVGTCNGDPGSPNCVGLPTYATPDRAAKAELVARRFHETYEQDDDGE